jgi:hypothetical protein
MHDFEAYLSASSDTLLSAERLRSMGKQAAARFVQDGVSLNSTIAGMVKEAGLTGEQTKRVVETANNTAFVELKRAGHKGNVSFPLADFNEIAGGEKTKVASPISVALSAREVYIPGGEGLRLEDLFDQHADEPERYGELVKEAQVFYTQEAPLPSHIPKQMALKKEAEADFKMALINMEEHLWTLGGLLKTAAAEGHQPHETGAALEMLGMSAGVQKVVAAEYPELVEFGHMLKFANAGMGPVQAGPLPGVIQSLEMTSQQLMTTSQLVQQAQMSMDSLLQHLRGMPPPMEPGVPGSDVIPQSAGPQGPVPAPGPGPGPAPGGPMPPQGPVA